MTNSYDNYKRILEYLLLSFKFSLFDDYQRNNYVYLRHDVDIMQENIPIIMKIEEELGIKSTWFFQPNNPFYNILSEQTTNIINSLLSKGFSVGLHLDCLGLDSVEAIQKEVTHLFAFFSRYFSLSPVISFHQPKPHLLKNIQIPGYINTYEERFFQDIRYFSDSKRRSFLEPMEKSLQEDPNTSIQLLTHPYWWSCRHLDSQQLLTRFCNSQLRESKRILARGFAAYSEGGKVS